MAEKTAKFPHFEKQYLVFIFYVKSIILNSKHFWFCFVSRKILVAEKIYKFSQRGKIIARNLAKKKISKNLNEDIRESCKKLILKKKGKKMSLNWKAFTIKVNWMRPFFLFFYLYSLNHEIFTQYQVEFALLMFDVMEIIAKVLPTPNSKFNQAEICTGLQI